LKKLGDYPPHDCIGLAEWAKDYQSATNGDFEREWVKKIPFRLKGDFICTQSRSRTGTSVTSPACRQAGWCLRPACGKQACLPKEG